MKNTEPKSTSAQEESPPPAVYEKRNRNDSALREQQRRSREATAARQARMAAQVQEEEIERAKARRRNPLLDLPEEQRSKLFVWLRECPYQDAVEQMLEGEGISGVTPLEMNEFFQLEAASHWERRIERAALEANALVSLVERNPVRFSSGILAALGQEAFRQIASGQVQPDAMTRIANLFLKARGDERAEQMLEMKREKAERDGRESTERALEIFAEEVNAHPEARKALEALRAELQKAEEGSV